MHKKINLNNPSTIEDAIKQLERLKTQRIPELCRQVLDKLADVGIECGKAHAIQIEDLGVIKDAILFRKTFQKTQDGYQGLVIVEDAYLITQTWQVYGQDRSADVSALLMAEFGSGQFANTDHMNIYVTPVHAGRGTFPNQKYANEPFWTWTDSQGRHRFEGIHPTMPVYNAYLEMEKQIEQIGKEVFRGL